MPAPKINPVEKYLNATGIASEQSVELKVVDIKCPRCDKRFTCNAAEIKKCQCYGIGLQAEDFAYLRQQGFSAEQTGCLCRDCLLAVKEVVKNS